MKSPILIATLALTLATSAQSQSKHQPYKGLETREIASMSPDDIEELSNGGGWGLALPAELNGHPGPRHVLELGEALGLSPEQTLEMRDIYKAMKAEAIAAGLALIDAERSIDAGFKSGALDPDKLRVLITVAENARANLRYIHLSRHLQSVDLLTQEQTAKYAELRGYASDPCQTVPEGHDPTMWRRHNGCDN